ncbi:MAG: TetR family transcriptional regulator [Vulcanimicrobiota bacterium]
MEPGKKKSERTREAILESARRAFLRQSYDQVGVREIAAEAGVNAALVNRYFGSKQGLFAEVLDSGTDYDELYQAAPHELGQQLARFLIEGELTTRSGKRLPYDPDRLMLYVRSIGCPEATAILRERLARKITGPMLDCLPEPGRQEKAALITSHLFGFLLIHRVVGAACVVAADKDILLDQLATSLQAIIDSGSKP